MSKVVEGQQEFSSVISLRSVSDTGIATSPKKQGKSTGGTKKIKKSASPYGTPSKKKTTKKCGREVWMSAVQGGGGLSTENSPLNTWKNGRPKNMKAGATDYLLEQLTGRSGVSTRPASASAARVGGKGPAYKDPESYYDEIQALKRTLKQLRTEHDLLKAKNGRLQDENVAKSRKIEELLNPDTQSNDLRRTLTSKNPNGSEVVMSLRRRIYKLEENLRNKENELRKLEAEMKVTNMEEMKIENQIYMFEIQRLSSIVQELNEQGVKNFISDELIHDAMRDSKSDKAQVLLKRLTEDNRNLVLENKSLKNDLLKMTQTDSGKVSLDKDYEDMNRSELLQKITALEQQLKEEEKRETKKEDKPDDEQPDPEAVDDRCIELKGPPPQQIKQLRARERELLTDVEKLEATVKKLKEDRAHYRKMTDDYRKQLEEAKKDVSNHDSDQEKTPAKKRPSVSSRKSSLRSNEDKTESNREQKVSKDKREVTPERRNSRKNSSSSEKKVDTIHNEEDEYDEAIISIQSAWRGHQTRQSYVETKRREKISPTENKNRHSVQEQNEDDKENIDDDISLIQSAFRGHSARKKMISEKKMKGVSDRDSSHHQRPVLEQRNNPTRNLKVLDDNEESDDDDDDVVVGSSTSLSRFRNTSLKNDKSTDGDRYHQHTSTNKNSKSHGREPKLYRDPDSTREQRERVQRGESRGKGNLTDFFEDGFVREGSRRSVDSEEREKDMSITKLKSSSQPWLNASHEIGDSEDDDVVMTSPLKKKNLDRHKTEPRKDSKSQSLTNKWANSGSTDQNKTDDTSFKKKLSMRKTQQLLQDFSADEKLMKNDNSDDDDLMIAPSFQKRMSEAMKKKSKLDDELF